MARCPWHGSVCECTENPFGPITEHWHISPMPARCEARLPLYMVNAYLKPQKVSDAMKVRYQKWVEDGMPQQNDDRGTLPRIAESLS